MAFKLKVVNEVLSGHLSKKAAALKFKIHRRRVQERCQQKAELEKLAKSSKRKKGSGRKVRFEDIEQSLIDWFEQRREKGVRVTGKGLTREALQLHKTSGNQSFKASCSWFLKFKRRHGLSFRRVTHIAQKSHDVIDEKIDRFLNNIIRHFEYDYACMGNMDETPIWLEMPGRSTLEHTGTSEVSVTTDCSTWPRKKNGSPSSLQHWQMEQSFLCLFYCLEFDHHKSRMSHLEL